jgi:hypothetical protein
LARSTFTKPDLPPLTSALLAQVAHESLDGAPGDANAFPVELSPDLRRPLHPEILPLDPGDLGLQPVCQLAPVSVEANARPPSLRVG